MKRAAWCSALLVVAACLPATPPPKAYETPRWLLDGIREKERTDKQYAEAAELEQRVRQEREAKERERLEHEAVLQDMQQGQQVRHLAWSAARCSWIDYRSATVLAAKEDQRYARELGGAVEPGRMQARQDQLRVADKHTATAVAQLARDGLKPRSCSDNGVALLVLCVARPRSRTPEPECQDSVIAAMVEIVHRLDPGLALTK